MSRQWIPLLRVMRYEDYPAETPEELKIPIPPCLLTRLVFTPLPLTLEHAKPGIQIVALRITAAGVLEGYVESPFDNPLDGYAYAATKHFLEDDL